MTALALILPSEAYRIDDFTAAAHRLGVEVVVVTDAHHGLAEDMGSSIIPVDFSDEDDAARRVAGASAQYDALLPIDDRGVRIAAAAADLRDLPHNSPDAAAAARDKALARQQVGAAVPQPRWRSIDTVDEAIDFMHEIGGPIVLKPIGLAGSMGVIRADDPHDLAATVERVRSIQAAHGYQRDVPLLAEEFVDGPEVSVEGLLHDGEWRTLAIFDKPSAPSGPYFPETYFVTPTRHPGPGRIEEAAHTAARAMGLHDGPVHAEFRLAPEPVLLELAARTIGGLCGRALRFGLTDTSLEEIVIRNALGQEVRGTSQAPGASGVAMLGVPRSGTFVGIDGVETAIDVPHITQIDVSAKRGTDVAPLPDESTYLGFVFARADTPDTVESALRAAVAQLSVVVE